MSRGEHWLKWVLLAVVRPLVAMWLMMEGAPEVVKALGQAVATAAKAMR